MRAEVDHSVERPSGLQLSAATHTQETVVRLRLGMMPGPAALAGADLAGADLSGVDLAGADLSGADLRGADLSNCRLERACLSGARLEAARLDGARLEGADLSRCHALGAGLRGADLRGSRVACADFEHADLRGARVAGMKGYRRARWQGADVRAVPPLGARHWLAFVHEQSYRDELAAGGRSGRAIAWLLGLTEPLSRRLGRWLACATLLAALFAAGRWLLGWGAGDALGQSLSGILLRSAEGPSPLIVAEAAASYALFAWLVVLLSAAARARP